MMLPEVAAEVLQDFPKSTRLARYMLGAWRIAPAWRAPFAGCVHADGTVRAQVVSASVPGQEGLEKLLRLLRERYDIHGVINTSLNPRGEPMLADRAAAAQVARRLGVDAIWHP